MHDLTVYNLHIVYIGFTDLARIRILSATLGEKCRLIKNDLKIVFFFTAVNYLRGECFDVAVFIIKLFSYEASLNDSTVSFWANTVEITAKSMKKDNNIFRMIVVVLL